MIHSLAGRKANQMDQRMSARAEWTTATISRGRNDDT